MKEQILFPQEVSAYRIGNESKVTIIAKGHEDGYTNIRIVPSLAQIYPPIYMVVADPSSIIGYFPYEVRDTIHYSVDLDYVQFQMEQGTVKIPVYDVMEKQDNVPAKLGKLNDNQVTGYAYNSSDYNKAFQDAVSKLQKKYPGNTSAKVEESGFVGVGSPVGIAFTYVIMEQNNG